MNLVITGGDGFIGRSCIDQWSSIHNITSLDKLSGVDISSDSNILESSIINCDVVYHAASPVGIDLIDQHRDSFLNDMIKMNLKVFNLVKKYNKKIVFFSTSEVYKDCDGASENDNLTIGSPNIPRWGYASGKLTSEFLCKSLCPQSVIIRPFNICGVYDRKGVLFSFMNSIRSGSDICIHGNGNQVRSFCDIRDLVAFLDILNSHEFNGEIYNVGNSENYISINELAKLCIDISNSSVKINYAQYSDCFSDKHRDIMYRKPNCAKMYDLYRPQYNLIDIIKSML
jgi:nucleoside-diphosphate-sugar epimerase